MSVQITVDVPLKTLAAYSRAADRKDAIEAVTKAIVENMDTIPYTVALKTGAETPAPAPAAVPVSPIAKSVSDFSEDGGALTPRTTLNTSALSEEGPTNTLTTISMPVPKKITIHVKTLFGTTFDIEKSNFCRWSMLAYDIAQAVNRQPKSLKLPQLSQMHQMICFGDKYWDAELPEGREGGPMPNCRLWEAGVTDGSVVLAIDTRWAVNEATRKDRS